MNPYLEPKNIINPYPLHNEIRDNNPVYELEPGVWIISRYEDVKENLKNFRLFTSKNKLDFCTSSQLSEHCKSDLFIATEDPPTYSAQRAAISHPFEKANIDSLKPSILEQAKTAIANIKNKTQFDFFSDFAYPYVGSTIDQLFGLNKLQSLSESREWISALEATTATNNQIDEIELQRIEKIILDQKHLFSKLIETKRTTPSNDFISDLVNSDLTVEQLVNALELLYRGGYQTTIHVLAAVVRLLIHNPDLLNTLIDTPRLISDFLNEALRLYSPVTMVIRHATDNVTIHGKTIKKGDAVWFSLAAANRDHDFFPNPNEISLSRDSKKPPIAFGFGAHVCLGLYLGKVEIEIALRQLLPLLNKMSCPNDEDLNWIPSMMFRGVQGLPIFNHN